MFVHNKMYVCLYTICSQEMQHVSEIDVYNLRM